MQTSLFIELDAEQQAIVDFIRMRKETGIEELIYGLNLPSSTLASTAGPEFKGWCVPYLVRVYFILLVVEVVIDVRNDTEMNGMEKRGVRILN